MYWFLFAAIAPFAAASALEARTVTHTARTAKVCSQVSAKCTEAAQLSLASSYCSSYTSITTVTEIVAATTITVEPSCSAPHIPFYFPESSYLAPPTKTPKPPRPSGTPACFGKGSNTQQVAASCDCLSLQTPYVTRTVSTATVTGPFRLQASVASTIYPRFPCGRLAQIKGADTPVIEWFGFINEGANFTLDQNGNIEYRKHQLKLTAAQLHCQPDCPRNQVRFVSDFTGYDRLQCKLHNDCALDCTDGVYNTSYAYYRDTYNIFWDLGSAVPNGYSPPFVPYAIVGNISDQYNR